MGSSALESAESWISFFWWFKLVAAALVTFGVGMEFAGDWLSRPYEKTIDNARKLEMTRLETRAKEAELELQQLRFPRSLDIEKFEAAVKAISPPTSYEVLYDANAPDASFLASVIWGIFFNAKWPTLQTTGAAPLKEPPPDILPYANEPWTVAAGGAPWGLSVVTHDPADMEKNVLGAALIRALAESVKGPPSQVALGYQTSVPVHPGGVRIIVGPKLP
jgi:hypothetical protein